MRIYTEEYLQEYEVKDLSFDERRERDKVARELRKEGWEVESKTYRFPDISEVRYYIHARRERKQSTTN